MEYDKGLIPGSFGGYGKNTHPAEKINFNKQSGPRQQL